MLPSPAASALPLVAGALLPLAAAAFRTELVEPLALRTDRETGGIARRDPDLAAQRDHGRTLDVGGGQLVLVHVVGEAVVVALVDAVVGPGVLLGDDPRAGPGLQRRLFHVGHDRRVGDKRDRPGRHMNIVRRTARMEAFS